jgi:uncharacterized protein YbjT (DUF2867 family)
VILVAGGSGNLGRRVVRLLVDAGERVRVLTRDRARCEGLPEGVEIVTGDLLAPTEVAAAVRGCTSVVSAVHGFAGPGDPSPERIDRDGNRVLIGAAKAGGVERFVLVSVCDARPDHPMSLHRSKYAAEEELRTSGLGFAIVRATAFLETWVDVIGGPLDAKRVALVFGRGKNPINFVSARDVAALVAWCARDGSPANEILEVGGPEDLDFTTFAERLIRAKGNGGTIKHIPLAVLRVMSVLARPFNPGFARKAGAAVVMNTTDQTFDRARWAHLPLVPRTTLDDVLASTTP